MGNNCFGESKTKDFQLTQSAEENQVQPSKTQPTDKDMAGEKRKRETTSPPKSTKKKKTKKSQGDKARHTSGHRQTPDGGFTDVAKQEYEKAQTVTSGPSEGSLTNRSTVYVAPPPESDSLTNESATVGHNTIEKDNQAEHDGTAKYRKEIAELKSQQEDMKNQLKEKDKQIKQKQTRAKTIEKGTQTDEDEKAIKEIVRLKSKLEENRKELGEKERQIKEIQTRFTNQLTNQDNKISALKTNIKLLQKEKDELLTRLSSMAGARLMDNNPNIADLSDANRPTKLAEKYCELYDNEWTEAFSELDASEFTDEDIIKLLLDILITTYRVCKEKADSSLKTTQQTMSAFLPPGTAIPPEMSKQLKENRKTNYKLYLPELEKVTDSELGKLKHMTTVILSGQAMKSYCSSCLELTWLMCIQDPPVYIDHNLQLRGKKFEKQIFKEYTRSGPLVDFVVWPVLYLQEGGAMLCKGTAQCTKSAEDPQRPAARGKQMTSIPVGAQTLPIGTSPEKIMNISLDKRPKTEIYTGGREGHKDRSLLKDTKKNEESPEPNSASNVSHL